MSTTTGQNGLTSPSLQQIELLARGGALPEREQRKLLEPLGFGDAAGAASRLGRLADPETLPILVELLPALLLSLSEASDPDMALVNLERFVQSVSDRAALYRYFRDEPRAVEILVKLFVGSQFLSEILIRNPRYLEQVSQHRRLAELKSREQFVEEAREVLASCRSEAEQLDALRRFQRWEILRIAACDVFGLVNLKSVTIQLASLADSLVRVCLEKAGEMPPGFSVLALGKLGGEELNYSSDIDLVFLAPSTAPDCWRVARKLIRALSDQTAEGFLYRVDMRLRPWGNSGTLVSTPASYLEYLEQNAQLWEKQALLKARVIAGDPAAGQEFLAQAQQWVFADEPDDVRNSVLEAKGRIESDLHRRGHHWGEVKLGIGSIRDVEFAVQYLQLLHGGLLPEIRSFNTLDALVRLADASLLHADEYRTLNDGYLFLRTIEHSLQLMHNKQCHRLPADPQELKYLARRLDFASASQFLSHYERHCAAIREIYERRLGISTGGPAQSRTPGRVARHVSRMEQSYAEAFTSDEITRHAEMAQRIDDERLVEFDAIPLEGDRWRVTIVAYDYLGELSLICGLLFAYGFDILEGQVFTYAPERDAGAGPDDSRQKIVDVFTVKSTHEQVGPDIWVRYARSLQKLLQLVHAGNSAQAREQLIQRVGAAIAENNGNPSLLYPVEIAINNEISDRYTVLEITSRDTLGFLYELTNSLALNGVYIAQVGFHSQGDYAHDTLYVTQTDGGKITGEQAHRELRAAVVLTKHFTHLLPHSANPAAALVHFREFLTELFARPNWPDELASVEQPDVLDALARLLGNSDFLWKDFLRMQHANLFPVLSDASVRGRSYSRDDLVALVHSELAAAPNSAARIEALNAFKDREMFRVDMRYILGEVQEFGQFSAELTDVAEATLQAAHELAWDELVQRYGLPLDPTGRLCPVSICALGKFGGGELGFASDIELMFVYDGVGETAGPEVIGVAEFFNKFVDQTVHAVHAKRSGVFQVDLRFRPYGEAGNLAVSLDLFRSYFGPEGAAWPYERQGLVKLRTIAGNAAFGEKLTALRDELVYRDTPFDVQAMRAMRERQLRQLVSAGTTNAKFGPGGVVEIEYLVQGLQITHGRRFPELRTTNTLQALASLARAGLLSHGDFRGLRDAYIFHRRLIDGLRVVRGHAKDLTVPDADSVEFRFLARRLAYGEDVLRLRDDLSRHAERVLEIARRVL